MSPSANLLKFIASVGLFLLWAWLVYTGRVPAAGLEHGIEAALYGLGVFHTAVAAAAAARRSDGAAGPQTDEPPAP